MYLEDPEERTNDIKMIILYAILLIGILWLMSILYGMADRQKKIHEAAYQDVQVERVE